MIALAAPSLVAQGPLPATSDTAAPAAAKLPACALCREALGSVDALRHKLPSEWTLERVREPVFGSEMLVVEAGAARATTVLLVHGLGQSGFTDWMPVLPQLARRFHVIAVDLPGYGYSDSPLGKYSPTNYARLLHWLLAHRAKGAAIVVGHSMGAAVALRLASEYRAAVAKLVLVDAAGILQRTAFVKHSATSPLAVATMPDILKQPVARIKDFGHAAVERIFGMPGDPTRLLRQSELAWELVLRNRSNVNAALALIDEDFSAAIYTLPQPVQIIWGEADVIAPLRTGQLLARRLLRAQLRTLPGVGHMPMETAPRRFLALLDDALAADPVAAAPPEPDASEGDDLVCRGLVDREFSGHYREVTIDNCTAVRLRDLSAERIVIRDSIVQLLNVQVRAHQVALDATNSEVIATASNFSGEIAIRADASRLDLAGVSLLALGAAVEVRRRSRLIGSVSEIHSPEYNGYWHDSVELEDSRLHPARARRQ